VEKAAVTNHPVHVVAEEGVELMGDRARIAQLVTQLVDNASKFSPPGSPITVRSVRDGDDALIEVDDRGPGIPVEQREVVFDRFVRWRPKGYEEQPGNGLGLFISRGLAAEHQGEISVEDGPGGGTMLRVRLPVGGAARG
jgi:two-component system sensor histidine kinase KdpD